MEFDIEKLAPTEGYQERYQERPERLGAASQREMHELRLPPKQRDERFVRPSRRAPQQSPVARSNPIEQLPNYDQLNPAEQFIYGMLPRIQRGLEPVQQAIERANLDWATSWGGKLLNIIDIGAEGIERYSGLAAQGAYALMQGEEAATEYKQNLRYAWAASHLAADMANIPRLRYDTDEEGKRRVSGINFDVGMPGVAGLVHAREKLRDMVENQGMEMSDAITQVQNEYYADLGALALRAQLNDTFVHIAGDPLNLVGAFVKPATMIKGKSIQAMFKAAPELIDAKLDLARAAGNLDEVARLTKIADDLADQGKVLGLADKIAIFATGGAGLADEFVESGVKTPWYFKNFVQEVAESKVPVVRGLAKQLTLTPEAKTYEVLDKVMAGVDNLVLHGKKDVGEIIQAIEDSARFATSKTMAHAAYTPEGRMIQAVLNKASVDARDLYAQYMSIADQRSLLRLASNALDEPMVKLLDDFIEDGPQAFAQRLRNAGVDEAIVSRLDDALFNKQLETIFKKGIPLDEALFRTGLSNVLRETTVEMAMTKFGVQEMGMIRKLSEAVKAGETLAFLRLNPGYAVRNLLNNEATIIARGLGGFVPDSKIDDFIKFIGYKPARMEEAFTFAGDMLANGSKHGKKYLGMFDDKAGKMIREAMIGERNWLDDFRDKFKDIELGVFDMGKAGRVFEKSASRRAYYQGFMEGWRDMFWRPNNYTRPRAFLPANQFSDEMLQTIDDALRTVGPGQSLDDVMRQDVTKAAPIIIDDIKSKYGEELGSIFGYDFVGRLESELGDAIERGPTGITELVDGYQQEFVKHIDELMDQRAALRVEHAKTLIEGAGPRGASVVISETLDDLVEGHIAHAMRMRDLEVSGLTGEAAHAYWTRIKADTAKAWGRKWQRWDDAIKGMRAAIDDMDTPGAMEPFIGQVSNRMDEFKKGWTGLIEEKNKLMDDYWKAVRNDQMPELSLQQIRDQTSAQYLQMYERERKLMQEIDDMVTMMLPEEARPFYASWRQEVRELMAADRQDVMRFYDELPGIELHADKEAAYYKLWSERMQRWSKMHELNETGIGGLMGDNEALDAIAQSNPAAYDDFARRTVFRKYGAEDFHELHSRNVVNKYLRGGYGETASYGDDAASRIKALQNNVRNYPDAVEASRADLPDWMSNELEALAKQYRADLPGGDAVKKGVGTSGTERMTENPEWYSKLYEEGINKKQVEAALDRIIEDKGKDVPKEGWVALPRVKEMLLNEMMGSIEGMPPSPRMLLFMGDDEKAADALLQWMQRADLNLTTEDMQELAGGADELEYLWEIVGRQGGTAPVEAKQFENLSEIPPDLLEEAFEARRLKQVQAGEEYDIATPFGLERGETEFEGFHDIRKLIDQEPDIARLQDQVWDRKGFEAIEHVRRESLEAAGKPPLRLADEMTPEQVKHMERYMRQIESDMADAVHASTRFAEWKRDAALLNYRRTKHINTNMSILAPYAFFATETIGKWFIHSIDKPTAFATYLRLRKMMATAGAPEQGFPSRLRKSLRFKAPFMPDWLGGELFVDPLGVALPFGIYEYPLEAMQRQANSDQSRAERVLETMAAERQITQAEYEQALAARDGPIWNRAMALAQTQDENRDGLFDFASMVWSPHAPLSWAFNFARGTPEKIGPLMPISRTAKRLYGMFGIEPLTHPAFGTRAWNVGASVRQAAGLPAFDQWHEYRIERMLSNMVATGEISAKEANRAMIEKQGHIYNMAADKAASEYARASFDDGADIGDVGTFLAQAVGIPMQVYPEGERIQRSLQDDFAKAYQQYEQGNEEALREFFDEHPEYESRLALWKEPDERLKSFMVDELWSQYHQLPRLHKKEIKKQLGDEWEYFLSEDRKGENISNEQLGTWLKLLGGDPPGTLGENARPLQLAEPEIANRVEVFYKTRNRLFPNYYEQQDEYYTFPEGSDLRRDYVDAHPMLEEYWTWRRDFMMRNPDTIPYLSDSYQPDYGSLEEYQEMAQGQPNYTWFEWQELLGTDETRAALIYLQGDGLPPDVEDYLELEAMKLGLTLDQMIDRVGTAYLEQ
jgi:hypothetical protein